MLSGFGVRSLRTSTQNQHEARLVSRVRALERTSDQVTLTVSDSGIGIPPEDLPHLFERFHRGRNASEYPGNGLGLAIVKAIVNAHQGSVAVRSEPMQGISISVSLPIL